MEQFLVKHASAISTFDYFVVIVVVSLLECIVPRRRTGDALGLRWIGNFTLLILDTLATRFIVPIFGFRLAILCAERGWGLFNQVSLPRWLEFALTLILLDLAIYALHYLSHHVPVLWRLHRLHHTDQDVDFTTGVRHHPLESIVSTPFNLAVIVVIGATPMAVLISQWIFLVIVFASHANMRITPSLDRALRVFFMTPDVHRVHHSVDFLESNSNLGNLFSWWDRLFGTYVAQPALGHEELKFGLPEFQGRKHLMLQWMIAQPFLRGALSDQTPLESQRRPAPEIPHSGM